MEDVFLQHNPLIIKHLTPFRRNPCYNGRCVSTVYSTSMRILVRGVAILVIMEDVFLPLRDLTSPKKFHPVAILVIMEDVFLQISDQEYDDFIESQSLL